MYISLVDSRALGFKKWSEAHQAHCNDDAGDVIRIDAVRVAGLGGGYAVTAAAEGPPAPWLVPGFGNTF
jgi:hypothetical protein